MKKLLILVNEFLHQQESGGMISSRISTIMRLETCRDRDQIMKEKIKDNFA
jgi:hypothetical protein